ncbi:MAG: HD-GYP domain-containing protein [Chthoniobacterales bacterium]|nr:HD-GYP domain-containing protein [Gemmatimonadaceae bacterium]MBA3833869.1 HD-GYP domain-containing protein [Chthoniobacterales bacterium]
MYITAVGICAVLLNGVLFLHDQYVKPEELRAVICMAAIGMFVHVLTFRLPRSSHGSIAFIPFLAAAIIVPSWIAALTAISSIVVAEVAQKSSRPKALFNILQTACAIGAATLVFRMVGGTSLLQTPEVRLLQGARVGALALFVLIAVFFAVNTVLVSGVISLSEQVEFLYIWRKNTIASLPYDLLSAPVVYLLAWVYVTSGAMGAIALCIPMIGVRQLYKTNSELERVNQELLELMVKAIEARDPYTSGHSRRVAHYSQLIARAIGLGGQQVERVRIAALLHDVGKIHEIYAPLLQKPEKLTPAEWEVMQGHPIKSAELVMTVSHLADIVLPVRHHHENWDGSGYPDGLSGEQIPLASRIVLFADTIDAMTTDRPYRKALGEVQVRSELTKYRAKQFDPYICDKLLASPMFGLLFAPGQRIPTPQANANVSRQPRALRAM